MSHFLSWNYQKKGGNVKTIPPYKPVTNEAGSSDPPSSPEKESDTGTSSNPTTAGASSNKLIGQTSTIINPQSMPKQRKSSGNSKVAMTNATVTLNIMNPLVHTINIGTSGIATATGGTSTSSSSSTNLIGTTGSSNSTNLSSSSTSKSTSGSSKDKDSKHGKGTSKVTAASRSSHDKDSSSTQSSGRDKATKSKSSTSKDTSGGVIMSDPLSMTGAPSVVTASTIVSNVKDGSALAKDTLGQKFTTSNFTETIVVNSESVFGSENVSASGKSGPSTSGSSGSSTIAKKRKADSGRSSANSSAEDINKYAYAGICFVCVCGGF